MCCNAELRNPHGMPGHRRSQGGKGVMPPKFLEYFVILCFESRCPKQNTVARLKSNDLAPPTIWAGYATVPAVYFIK